MQGKGRCNWLRCIWCVTWIRHHRDCMTATDGCEGQTCNWRMAWGGWDRFHTHDGECQTGAWCTPCGCNTVGLVEDWVVAIRLPTDGHCRLRCLWCIVDDRLSNGDGTNHSSTGWTDSLPCHTVELRLVKFCGALLMNGSKRHTCSLVAYQLDNTVNLNTTSCSPGHTTNHHNDQSKEK